MSTQDRTPSWPDEQLCNSCFYTAMRTRGICPICGHDGVLPGRFHLCGVTSGPLSGEEFGAMADEAVRAVRAQRHRRPAPFRTGTRAATRSASALASCAPSRPARTALVLRTRRSSDATAANGSGWAPNWPDPKFDGW